jgi:glucose-6-phosphate 1-dehydrogenase
MDPHVIVLFGSTGDLARRKLWPGMFHLYKQGLLPDEFRILGSGRGVPDDFKGLVAKAVGEDLGDFADRISFVPSSAEDGEEMAKAVHEAIPGARKLIYMSIPPSAMQSMVAMLGRVGLDDDRTRIVLEKPFGHDLESCKALNAALHEHFDESQIFRIDHFLGKEAAQDVLALRFANGLFEPIWNRDHVASVQIDVPETLGLEGRASFYEETGAFKDMVVTHLSQIMGFVAMEPPESLDAGHLRDAKAAAFRDLRPFTRETTVFGQFAGYRDEDGVARDSRTETFVALRAEIDNDRWRGVPFLLRTGKAMAQTRRVITLSLNDPAKLLFGADGRPDELVIELTDDPRIACEIRVKKPGPTLDVAHAWMELDVERSVGGHGLEAYERLLLDVMHGDHLLFTRADEVELLWERAAPLQADPPDPQPYEKGSWGPDAALELAASAGGWRLPE